MSREELRMHLLFVHRSEAKPQMSTDDLVLDHAVDHESAMSVREGLAAHRHAPDFTVDGVSEAKLLAAYTGPRDPEARW